MDVAERPINFTSGPSEIALSEEALQARTRKLQEAKRHLAAINEKILELQVMLRRLSRKPRFHKLQYVLKHRVAVYSGNLYSLLPYLVHFLYMTGVKPFSYFFLGLRSVYLKFCCNLQEDINQHQQF